MSSDKDAEKLKSNENKVVRPAGDLLSDLCGNRAKSTETSASPRDEADTGLTKEEIKQKQDDVERITIETKGVKLDPKDFNYATDHPQRGCFIIFNQENFWSFDPRVGSQRDVSYLENIARILGFEFVFVRKDLKKSEIFKLLYDVASASHETYDCFACAFLTHGEENDVLHAKDASFPLKEVLNYFTPDHCPSLAGKPKIFFIQACRGRKTDKGVKLRQVASDTIDSNIAIQPPNADQVVEYTIPKEADFLIVHSTPSDYFAFRNTVEGSIFVKCLHDCLIEYGPDLEIMQLLSRVNKTVAYSFESNCDNKEYNNKKQIPSITSRLTAELRFTPKQKSGETIAENST